MYCAEGAPPATRALVSSDTVEEPRYCSVEVLSRCGKCGAGLPVNGLLWTVPCPSCHTEASFSAAFWHGALRQPDDRFAHGEGSFQADQSTRVTWSAEPPSCAACGAGLPVDQVPAGTQGTVTCVGCGAGHSVVPAPAWLEVPSARQVYCAEREEDRQGAPAETPGGDKPVFLSCPQCQGSLSVTAQSERLVVCQYCSAEVFLPDALWLRLHPVRKTSKWFVRYEGESLASVEQRQEEDRQRQYREQLLQEEEEEEQQEREEERRQRAEDQARWEQEAAHEELEATKRKPITSSQIVWTLLGAFIGTVLISVLLPLLAGDGDPLFGLAGAIICDHGDLTTESYTTTSTSGTATSFDFYCPSGPGQSERAPIPEVMVVFVFLIVIFPISLVGAVAILFVYRSN